MSPLHADVKRHNITKTSKNKGETQIKAFWTNEENILEIHKQVKNLQIKCIIRLLFGEMENRNGLTYCVCLMLPKILRSGTKRGLCC